MNVKITKSLHEELCKLSFKEYLFGSQLHGISNENSDYDYLRVVPNDFYSRFTTPAKYLPNVHSFQYTESQEKQYLWMTESQFWRGLFSGDANLIADIVIFSGEFDNPLDLCYSYKIIKGYVGVTKRDLKLHKDWNKKVFHSLRSVYMAERLMNKELPIVSDIIELYRDNISNLPEVENLKNKESNNIKEFKYENNSNGGLQWFR